MITKTKTILIVFLLADIVIVSIFFSLFFFTKSLTSDTSSKEEEIKGDIKREESVSLMKKDVGFGKDSESELSGYLLGKEDSDAANFIKVLENAAGTSSLSINVQSISYEEDAKLDAVRGEYVRIKLNISGKWENVLSFIKFLTNYPLKIDIKSISLGSTDTKWGADIDFTAVKLKN